MEFTIEFCTKTQTQSPIFIGFKRPQKLLKMGLYLSSIRTKVCHVRTDFCDILKKQRNSILIRFASGRLDQVFERSSLKPFRVQTEFWRYLNYWISSKRIAESSGRSANTGHRPNVMLSRPDGLQIRPKQCRLLKIDSLWNND